VQQPTPKGRSSYGRYLHKAGIKSSSPDDAYQALTTLEGLSGWWTGNTAGETSTGGVIQFRFGAGGIDMKVLELDPARRVLWQVVDGPQEWIGTKVSFDLRQEGDWTLILFKHQVGRSRWSSCTIAAPSGASFC
jgi:hypothetical protein